MDILGGGFVGGRIGVDIWGVKGGGVVFYVVFVFYGCGNIVEGFERLVFFVVKS